MGENWAKAERYLGVYTGAVSLSLVHVSTVIQAVLFLLVVFIRPRSLAFPGTCFLSVCDQNVLAGLSKGIVPVNASWCGDM